MTDQIILGFAMISDVEHQLNPGQIFEFIPLSLGSAGLLCVRRWRACIDQFRDEGRMRWLSTACAQVIRRRLMSYLDTGSNSLHITPSILSAAPVLPSLPWPQKLLRERWLRWLGFKPHPQPPLHLPWVEYDLVTTHRNGGGRAEVGGDRAKPSLAQAEAGQLKRSALIT